MGVTVHQFPCLEDNYGFLVRDEASGAVASIDTPDAAAILQELGRLGWGLDLILNTHWHPDHAGGNEAIRASTGATAVGPAEVGAHFPVDRIVRPGDVVRLGESAFHVIDGGGHTHGHLLYHLEQDGLLFAGDTLFPMGCGRLFEGTAEQMWSSLCRIASLPAETVIYSAHEYTLGNARFALSVDDSPAVARRAADVAAKRDRGEPTVPTTVGQERETNPFLRAPSLAMTASASSEADAFGLVRAAKDVFRG